MYDCFCDFPGKFIRFGCTTALDIVPWETDGESVYKQGNALGRSVDLTKFNNYDELIVELDTLFDFNGELKARTKTWQVVYTDDKGDMILVGDDPWREFIVIVRNIYIYPKDEVESLNLGALNLRGSSFSDIHCRIISDASHKPETIQDSLSMGFTLIHQDHHILITTFALSKHHKPFNQHSQWQNDVKRGHHALPT
ncbi:auxin response factor 2A isoform X1 [Tanacetum coccineum]